MKTKNYLLALLLIFCFVAANTQAQQIVGYSGLFTFNTVGAQLTADFTIDTTGFNGKMVGGNGTGFVYDINQSIQFLDKSVGAALPNNWTWNFGDGSPAVKTQNPTHAFSRPGNYTVNLSVANQAGVADDVVKTDYIVVGQPNYGIELEIIETGGTNEVKWVGYQYWNDLLEFTTVNNFPVLDHKALISWDSKINGQTDFNDEIILYGEVNGVKKQIGHIYFEYEHSDEKGFIRNAIIIFHNTGMDDTFPYQFNKGEYDWRWDYYKIGEYPVSMLIPPNNIFQETYSKTPLLLIHGWEGKFNLERNPDAKAEQNETSYWFTTVSKLNKETSPFDTWQYYYPYNSAHNHLAICLMDALEKLKSYYTNKKIRLVTHSMGGLVTLNYVTLYPDSAKLKVEKVLFLAPPAHGSLGANLYYKTTGSIGLQPVITYDRHAPAVRDMKLGSNTNWGIQSISLPDLNNENGAGDDYFVLLGTTFKFYKSDTYVYLGKNFGHSCIHEEAVNHHDGIVSISSGSLLDKGVGFATFHGNHNDAVHMQSFKRDDPANQNIGNADLLPDIITEYFMEDDDATFINWMKNNQDITTIVTADGDSRSVIKPTGQYLSDLNTNNGVDYQKGILNIEFATKERTKTFWAYYNPEEKILSLRRNQLHWTVIPTGIFIQNKHSDDKRRYYFNDDALGITGKNPDKGEVLYNGCAIKLQQGDNKIKIYNYSDQPDKQATFNFRYCESSAVTIGNLNKSKYPDENSTDNKENLIVSTGTTVSDTLLSSFFIDDQTTSLNFNVSAEKLTDNNFDVEFKMKLPNGTQADSTFEGSTYHFDHELGLINMELPNPMPGKWHVWLESDYPGADTVVYNAVTLLQSEVFAWLPDTAETAAAHRPFSLHAGLKVNDFGLASGLNVLATVNRPDGEKEIFDISSSGTTQDSSYIFTLDYSFELPGEYLVKYNIDGVYNNFNFERCLYFPIEAIDTIPAINIPDIVLRQQEPQKTLNLSQYIYNVDNYDTLYFSSEIIASNLDPQEFTATLDSLALSAYLTTNLADTGTVMMRFNCHFDDQVISDTVEIKVLLPELLFEAFQFADSIASNASFLTVNYTVGNSGNFYTGSYDVRYYLSQDSLVQPEDYCLGLKPILYHNADTTLSILDTINIPVLDLAGTYYLLTKLDAINQINETDETNNLAIQRIYLNLPPSPPAIVSAIPDDGIVDLIWKSNNQSGISGYIIYYSLDSTAVLNKVYTLSSDTSHTVSGLINDTTYYFAISAYKMMGNESQRSFFVSATPTAFKNQLIELPQGWSGISTYLSPFTNNIEPLFQPILSDLIILQSSAGMYWPGQNINTLGNWNTYEGYQIKVANAVELSISGSKTMNKTLQLSAGWNLIPVLSECGADVATLFEGQNLVIVKEVAGWNMYWPEFGINTLGSLAPGNAYFVLMGSNGIIEFPDCTNLTGFQNLSGLNTTLPNLTGFQNLSGLNPSALTHTLAIPWGVYNGFKQSDIIAVMDESGNCFGAVRWQSQTTAITIFGNDPTTPGKDGFDEHDPLFFKLIRGENKHPLEVVFDPSLPQLYKEFVTNGLSSVRSINIQETGILPTGFERLIKIIPNPAKDEFKLVLPQEDFGKCTLKIYSADGQLVNNIKVFRKESNVNINNLSPGVFVLKIEMDDAVVIKMLVKN